MLPLDTLVERRPAALVSVASSMTVYLPAVCACAPCRVRLGGVGVGRGELRTGPLPNLRRLLGRGRRGRPLHLRLLLRQRPPQHGRSSQHGLIVHANIRCWRTLRVVTEM